jgi:hypothetical protein
MGNGWQMVLEFVALRIPFYIYAAADNIRKYVSWI